MSRCPTCGAKIQRSGRHKREAKLRPLRPRWDCRPIIAYRPTWQEEWADVTSRFPFKE